MRSTVVPTAALVVLASSVAGGLFGARVLAIEDRVSQRERMYAAAVAAIESEYVEPLDSAQLVYGSIDGMLHTLDPHSSFFNPKEFAQMRERQEGHYYGIGIQIASIDGVVTVTSLFDGSPAVRVGFRRGDIIARVGKEDAKGWTTEDVVKRVKGPKGTTVDMTLSRPGLSTPIEVTVERDKIDITTVPTAFMLAPGTGYIKLREFSETSDDEVGAALKKLTADGMQRLVFDLRDNPGGPLDQAIAVSNRFLKKGQMIVYTEGRVPRSSEKYRANEEGGYTGVPMIVLVSRQSASASEIVTGAMQDHDRALVVGETSFGKALVQSVYSIDEGAALALTTAHYYTPSGRLIQRPWDNSFDEYQMYTQKDQNGTRPHPASELKYTDGGRKVYGGGGIEPDHFVAGPIEGFVPTSFSRLLVSRGAFISFVTKFARDGDARPGAKSAAKFKVAQGWQVSSAMIDEFHQFVAAGHLKFDEAAFKADQPFIAAMIHYEVDGDLFGAGEARKNLIRIDPQAQQAQAFFDEARKLLDLKKGQ
jgi:carboxyl-terminal processing protease